MNDLVAQETTFELANPADIKNELIRVNETLKSVSSEYNRAADLIEQSEKIKPAFQFPVWAIIVGFIVYLVPGAIMLIVNIVIKNSKGKANQTEKERLTTEANYIVTEANHKLVTLNSPIPQKYLFSTCMEYALELYNTGRANTLPELYDRLDAQIHRWTLEAQNDKIMAQQLALNQQMSNVEASARSASAGSGLAAAASIINLFR